MIKIIIPGELCDLNTYIDAERSHRIKAAKIKRQETERVAWLAKGQKLTIGTVFPIIPEITWYVKDLRKDSDNLVFAKKFLADGLVMAKVIPNDSRKYVKFWKDIDILVDKKNPRVEIIIN